MVEPTLVALILPHYGIATLTDMMDPRLFILHLMFYRVDELDLGIELGGLVDIQVLVLSFVIRLRSFNSSLQLGSDPFQIQKERDLECADRSIHVGYFDKLTREANLAPDVFFYR